MHFEIRRSEDGEYFWRIVGGNNETMASSETYIHQSIRPACDRRGESGRCGRAGLRPDLDDHGSGATISPSLQSTISSTGISAAYFITQLQPQK